MLNKQAEEEERNKKIKLLKEEISNLEKRIYKAKNNVIKSEDESIKKAHKENRIPLVRFSVIIILIGLIGGIAGLFFVNEFGFTEGYIMLGCCVFILLIGIPLLIHGIKLSPSKEEFERIKRKYIYLSEKENEQVLADKLIIQKLEKELNTKKQELRRLM